MASPLRHPLSGLIWLLMAAIYLPLLPAGAMLVAPAFSAASWQALLSDPQLPRALIATLTSALIATLGALFLALLCVTILWPGVHWQRMNSRLPWLLAIPHVAFATGVLLTFAEGGLLFSRCPLCSPPADVSGIGLGLTLAVKESAFVLWAIYAVLQEQRLRQQNVVLQSLGYGRLQRVRWLVIPAIAPALGAVMLAVLAWSLSVVDVAIILGPGNPPTLAVLAWQWLSQGDAGQQAKGTLLCLILLLLAQKSALTFAPLASSLSFGLLSALLALIAIFLWLEWGPRRGAWWVWLPLALPALPLVSGQYYLALRLGLDGEVIAVLWGHLLWVLPWMLLVLQPAWRRLDPRLILTARTLGWQRGKIFILQKCPLLVRPALLAFATGFSVSIAQYMPTLWLGAGRYATLTTEAVALSSGGSVPLLANQALGLLVLTGCVFAIAALLSRLAGHYRQGLR